MAKVDDSGVELVYKVEAKILMLQEVEEGGGYERMLRYYSRLIRWPVCFRSG